MAKNKSAKNKAKANAARKDEAKNILPRDLSEISAEFSILDRAIQHALVSSLRNAPGALPRENLEALVGQVIQLGGAHAKGHFHRGYLDALSGTPLREPDGGEPEERRWYLCGYLETKADAEKPALLKSLSGNDRGVLLEGNSEASAILFPQLIAPLLQAGDLKNARSWIESHAKPGDLHFATVVHDWAHPAMLNANKDDFGKIEGLLEAVWEKLDRATGSASANGELPALARRIERIYAICLRMEGKFGKAQARLDGLLQNGGGAADRQELLAQRALCKIGIQHYQDDMVFPLKHEHQKKLPEAMDDLQEAAQGENASPLALVLLAFPALSAPAETENPLAIEQLQRAVGSMQQSGQAKGGGPPVWERSGLLDRARFYLAFLELRTGKKGKTARRAVEQLSEGLRGGVRLPTELELEAMNLASENDPRSAAELAPLVLKLHGIQVLGALDENLAAQSQELRSELAKLLESPEVAKKLNADERWNAWRLLLSGSSRASKPDREMATSALDALEILAQSEKKSGDFIALLEEKQGDWRTGWDIFEQQEALVRLHRESGNPEKAMAGCFELAQSYMSKKRITEALSTMETMRELNPEGQAKEALDALENRLQKEFRDKRGDEEEEEDHTPVSLMFVGGNEKQENYRAKLDKEMAEQNIAIEWHFTNWNSNWGRIKDELSNRIHRADAVILMQFVRTGLGQSVRKLAGTYEKPWIPCPGHGHNSLRQAILKAAQVARRTKAGSGA
ncbi:MAG: hypothetical protein OXU65_09595 [Deltaproteobacteria bacterium]|nr:hypothetical protein [Deltaproteobacteria bacterium]